MLMIRLQRVGRKNDPSFRLVLVDSRRSTKSGSYLEILGSHNARRKKTELDTERIKHWITKGAQVSESVRSILTKNKAL